MFYPVWWIQVHWIWIRIQGYVFIFNYCEFIFLIFHLFASILSFICVDLDPYSEYGSGSTELVYVDPIPTQFLSPLSISALTWPSWAAWTRRWTTRAAPCSSPSSSGGIAASSSSRTPTKSCSSTYPSLATSSWRASGTDVCRALASP